jgi:outer membrane protein OmpA-like peptidoglycan-associated protein
MYSRTLVPLTLCLAAVVGVAAPASAQGSIEFGGFGSYTRFDNSLTLKDQPGAGGRLSVVSGSGFNTWILEAEGAYATQGIGPLTFRYIPARARLLYALPLGGSASFILGGGGVRNDYSVGSGSTVEWGYTGLAGFRLQLGSFMALRVEGVMDYVANPANESATLKENFNQGLQAGLSFPLYRDAGPVREPKSEKVAPREEKREVAGADADKDGVIDANDACSNTPASATVDPQGCQVYRDTDNDGVIDPRDACPATLAGAAIDGRGCAIGDSDGDGVTNTQDRCPNSAIGDRVDSLGCTIVIPKQAVDSDADLDGVPDSRDRCPATPVGASADAAGCTIVIPKPAVDGDADNDGVPDSRDKCPATPAGDRADASGCTILFKNAERTVTLRGVNFATGREELTPTSFAVLDDVARQLIEAPSIRIEIVGHTDATGGRTRNIRLSLGRAEAVRAYLIMQGVPSERLVARGFGPDQPIANNGTPSGRAMNRRVELRKIN